MSFFSKNAEIINSKLIEFFNTILSSEQLINTEEGILEHIKEFTLRGGKRIRASLVEVGFLFFKQSNQMEPDKVNLIHNIGIVMELLQSFFLIHDDIIDKAPLRRGLETLHLLWAKEYDENLHIGESIAILAGNYALVTAYKILQDLKGINDSIKLALIKLVNRVVQDTLAGQILDVQVTMKSLDDTRLEDVLEIMRLKTAKYTIVAPLQFGAILAGANAEEIDSISTFGVPFGLAFQISDDIIGTFGSEQKTGKSINSDLIEGKKTLFIVDAYEKCSTEEKKIFKDVLGSENLPHKQYDKVREIITNYKSKDYAQEQIEAFASEGKAALNSFIGNSHAKELLMELASQQVNRSS